MFCLRWFEDAVFLGTRVEEYVLKGKALPENAVILELAVSHYPYHAAKEIDRVLHYVRFYHVEEEVIEEALRTKALVGADFEAADNLVIIHLLHKHGQDSNNPLEEEELAFFGEHRLLKLVQHRLVKEVKELNHVPCLVLVQQAQNMHRI